MAQQEERRNCCCRGCCWCWSSCSLTSRWLSCCTATPLSSSSGPAPGGCWRGTAARPPGCCCGILLACGRALLSTSCGELLTGASGDCCSPLFCSLAVLLFVKLSQIG